MAIIVDPDNIDRNQVIFGTTNRLISIYPVGSLVNSSASGTNGSTTINTQVFTSTGATFTTWGVLPGDVLAIFNGNDAGHYEVLSVGSQTTLNIRTGSWNEHPSRTNFSGTTNAIYQVRRPLTGSLVDGVSLQALYSFAKEEWRVDSSQWGGDDLIRHEFPFEAITAEQFEIGGGVSHENWEWFNFYTKKKLRTAGWEKKNTANSSINRYAGIITLGSLDSDTQVYYQPLSSTAAPVNFSFLGPVNEPALISGTLSGSYDTRQYLKLFARKKARTYSQTTLTDIGVTTMQTIVNRFPLAHANDAAITAADAEISGSSPWRNQTSIYSNTNGVTANVDGTRGTITSVGATFTTFGVTAGDTVRITSGANQGYYTIVSVDSETQLTLDTSEAGTLAGASSISFTVSTTYAIRPRTDGIIANLTNDTGYLSSSAGGFTAAVTASVDYAMILEAGSVYAGIYKITSVANNNQLILNTRDRIFPAAPASSIDFAIVRPGMYLQYKQDLTSSFNAGNIQFINSNPDTITRTAGSWVADNVTSGTILTFAGTTNNNDSFTVASVNALTATLVATDAVIAEGPVSCSLIAENPFKRVINNITYGFRWRCFGNNTTLNNIYQFVQHQLRQTTDIDWSNNTHRGDVTDLLMSFASPTGQTFDMFIDDVDATDINNVTYRDASASDRVFPFAAAGTISFNSNLVSDNSAVYRMFFTSVPDGSYGLPNAIIVNDADNIPISGSVSGQSSIQFTFDYDGNTQGSRTAGTDAPVTVIAIGLSTAQFVLAQATIGRSKANNISLVASLERNYST